MRSADTIVAMAFNFLEANMTEGDKTALGWLFWISVAALIGSGMVHIAVLLILAFILFMIVGGIFHAVTAAVKTRIRVRRYQREQARLQRPWR
jgi:hypothetical protein